MDEIKLILFMLEKARPPFPGMRHKVTLCEQGLELTLMLGPNNHKSVIIPTPEPDILIEDHDFCSRAGLMVDTILELTSS